MKNWTRLVVTMLALQMSACVPAGAFGDKPELIDLTSDTKLLPIIVDGKTTDYSLDIPLTPTVDDWSSMGIRPNAEVCFKTDKAQACRIAEKGKVTTFRILYDGAVRLVQFRI